MNINLDGELQKILDEYVVEVEEDVEESAKATAQAGAKELRANSPKDRGNYARSWGYKKQGLGIGETSYVIYNKRYPGLSHLIENGHIEKNQYGTYGRVRGYPHIKPVEAMVNQKFLEEITNRLKK